MKTSSAKAKGRNLCKYVKAHILQVFDVYIPEGDIKVTSSGAQGEDLQFSEEARCWLPISIECKSHARYAIYKDYEQAKSNAGKHEPVVIIKQNDSKPLAIVDLDYFIKLHRDGIGT